MIPPILWVLTDCLAWPDMLLACRGGTVLVIGGLVARSIEKASSRDKNALPTHDGETMSLIGADGMLPKLIPVITASTPRGSLKRGDDSKFGGQSTTPTFSSIDESPRVLASRKINAMLQPLGNVFGAPLRRSALGSGDWPKEKPG